MAPIKRTAPAAAVSRKTASRHPVEDTPVIQPTAVYLRSEAMRVLRLGRHRLDREISERRIQVRQDDGRQLFLGQWLLDWVSAGSIQATQATQSHAS